MRALTALFVIGVMICCFLDHLFGSHFFIRQEWVASVRWYSVWKDTLSGQVRRPINSVDCWLIWFAENIFYPGYIQRFEVCKIVFNVFERSLLCSSRLHLFDQKYGKTV